MRKLYNPLGFQKGYNAILCMFHLKLEEEAM